MLILVIYVLTVFSSYSADNILMFKSLDSKAEIVIVESKQSDSTKYYFKLLNSSEADVDKVMLFDKAKDNCYSSVNGVSPLALLDYDKRVMVKGTSKKAWTLAGLNKSLIFYESTPPKTLTAPSVIEEYNASEGSKSVDLKSSIEVAQTTLKEKCKTNLKISTHEFKLMPHYKIVPAINGISDLCGDADYLKAVQDLKEIKVKATVSNLTPVLAVKSGVLTIDLGKVSDNTYLNIKQLAAKTL